MGGSRTRTVEFDDPSVTSNATLGKSGLEFLRELIAGKVAAPPFQVTLGFQLLEADDGMARYELVPGERRSTILPEHWLQHAPDEISRSAGQAASYVIEAALRSRRIIWGLGGLVLIASTVIGYLAWRRMTPDEAAVVLQDTVWTETRREERKINRWLAWRLSRWGKPS